MTAARPTFGLDKEIIGLVTEGVPSMGSAGSQLICQKEGNTTAMSGIFSDLSSGLTGCRRQVAECCWPVSDTQLIGEHWVR